MCAHVRCLAQPPTNSITREAEVLQLRVGARKALKWEVQLRSQPLACTELCYVSGKVYMVSVGADQ